MHRNKLLYNGVMKALRKWQKQKHTFVSVTFIYMSAFVAFAACVLHLHVKFISYMHTTSLSWPYGVTNVPEDALSVR